MSMKFFFILSGKSIKQALIILIAAFFTASIIYIENSANTVFSTDDGPRAIYKGANDQKVISLSFDISWGDDRAEPILDYLKEKQIHTTFFVSGVWAERHPDLIERILKDGHEIGLMGYRYKSYTRMDISKVRQDILQGKQVLRDLGVKQVSLLRPPNGAFNKDILKLAESLELTIVHWSVNPKDWTNPGVNSIVNSIKESIQPGDIILLHASDSAKQTLEALPQIVNTIKSKGYKVQKVSELIDHIKTQNSEVD